MTLLASMIIHVMSDTPQAGARQYERVTDWSEPAPQPLSFGPPFPRNGLGLASVILGTLGVIFGLTLVGFFIALVLGVVGVAFGFVGRARAHRREASNPRQATWGLALSAVAVVLAFIGPLFVLGRIGDAINNTFNKNSTVIDTPSSTETGPSSGEIQKKFMDCMGNAAPDDPDYDCEAWPNAANVFAPQIPQSPRSWR